MQPATHRVRVKRAPRKERQERWAVLPLDPRDPEVVRAKRVATKRAS
jgi:hypothetical protein